MGRLIVFIVFLLNSQTVFGHYLLGKVLEPNADYKFQAKHTYILKILHDFSGEYSWNYKKIVLTDLTSTQLIHDNNIVLIDDIDLNNSAVQLMDVFDPVNKQFASSPSFVNAMAKRFIKVLNWQNKKYSFLKNGRMRFVVNFKQNKVEILYEHLSMPVEAAVVINYYLKKESGLLSSYFTNKDRIAFDLQVKDTEFQIYQIKNYGSYKSLTDIIRARN